MGKGRREATDEDLVRRVASGDLAALADIDRRYRRRLLTYARSLLGRSGAEAEDVIQDVFVRAHTEIAAGRGPARLGPWLFRLVRNRSIDERRRARWGDRALDPLDGTAAALAAADLEDPPAVLHRRESLRTVVQDLADLPVRQRDALLARVVDGDSPAESAARLGVSVEAVQMLVVRGRRNLERVRAVRRARGDLETQLLALGSPAAALGFAGFAKLFGAGGGKLVAAGVAAVVAAVGAGGVEILRSQQAGPGQPAPFALHELREYVGHSLARGEPLPAGTAVVGATVRVPAGERDDAHQLLTLRCPTGMRFATMLSDQMPRSQTKVILEPADRVWSTLHTAGRFRLHGPVLTTPATTRIRILCRQPGRSGSLFRDPRLPHADEGRGVVCHTGYLHRGPEHLITGTAARGWIVAITRRASRSVYVATEERGIKGWLETAALCPGWTMPPSRSR